MASKIESDGDTVPTDEGRRIGFVKAELNAASTSGETMTGWGAVERSASPIFRSPPVDRNTPPTVAWIGDAGGTPIRYRVFRGTEPRGVGPDRTP